MSPANWLPVHRDQLRAQRSVTSMGKPCLFTLFCVVYDSCAQWYAHKYKQFLNLCLVRDRLVFVFLKMFSLYFCVFLYYFTSLWFCVVSFCWFCIFHYQANRLAGKNVFEMAYFVSSGMLNLAPSILEIWEWGGDWVKWTWWGDDVAWFWRGVGVK